MPADPHASYAFHSPLPTNDLAALLRSGEVPLADYLAELAERFTAVEPHIQAFVSEDGRFDRLYREAQHLLATYPDPATRPSLFGLPVGIKDIFHVAGFTTRAGCQLPTDLLQGAEAQSVRRLRAAGALIVGKTITTEFAYFAPGPTRNPHRLEHTPGGSSSGSAAAVSAGLCALALGTQTIGSISRPAAFCGVVGYKPSYERISRAGVIPLSAACDHVGYFAPDVVGAALAAPVLVDGWRAETAVTRPPRFAIPDGPYLEHASLEGLAHFQAACEQLKTAGFAVKSVAVMADFADIYTHHNQIVAAEAAQVHADWFASYGHLYHAKSAELIRRGLTVSAAQLATARAGQQQLRRTLQRLMTEQGIDVWLSPAALGAAPAGLDSTGDPVMNLPWTHAGLPTITLPAGTNANGLPFGLQLTGGWQADEQLFEWAGQIEKNV
ncbi:MAG: amidase [Chloroflexi bacterium]|nr:amidase [Chloroflexota bacterium]MBP7044583.1 amidase [Chloroflexota bacterium]